MELKYQITITGIVISSIAVPLIRFFYKKYVDDRPSVFFEEFNRIFVDLNSQLDVANILDSKGKISCKRIMHAHEVIFSNEPFCSGKYRTSDVEIMVPTGTDESAIVGTVHVSSQIDKYVKGSKTLYKQEVALALKKNCKMWNRWVVKKARLTDRSKLDLASRFHTYFLIIHPFEDGNGRFGRRLLSEQLSFLFDKHIEFDPKNKNDYYIAINKASCGDESQLKKLILEAIAPDDE